MSAPGTICYHYCPQTVKSGNDGGTDHTDCYLTLKACAFPGCPIANPSLEF